MVFILDSFRNGAVRLLQVQIDPEKKIENPTRQHTVNERQKPLILKSFENDNSYSKEINLSVLKKRKKVFQNNVH